MINEGSTFPDFLLMDQDGRQWRLQDFSGAMVVFYFYPKDDTSGCTKEACDFRDNLTAFKRLKVQVIGISKDNVKKHDKFKEKYELNFPLASDEDGKICDKYGVWVEKIMYGRKYMGIERATFLIDADGKIAHIWRKVSVTDHVTEVLKVLKELKKAA